MKDLGYDKPLYILPFDHRGSFQDQNVPLVGQANSAQTAEIAASKWVLREIRRLTTEGKLEGPLALAQREGRLQ